MALFNCRGVDASIQTLAEGLASEIKARLTRFSYLCVIAASSSEKAARYVIDSGIRQAGARLHIAVQLTVLWRENHTRRC